jgi:hypothetical protein
MQIEPYDLKLVVVTIDSTILEGGSDQDFVTVEPDGQAFNDALGSRGEVAVSATNNNIQTITLSIWQGSKAIRERLDAIVKRQKLNLKANFVRISVKDLSTGESVTMPRCWIRTEPTRAFGADQQARDYVFRSDDMYVNG